MSVWLYLLPGLLSGAIVVWLIMKGQLSASTSAVNLLKDEKVKQEEKQQDAQSQINELTGQVATLQAKNEHLIQKLSEQQKQIDEMQKRLLIEFENIANRVLDSNTRKLSDQNKEKLGEMLTPVKDRLEQFNKTVQDTYEKNTRERSGLFEQVKNLVELNKTMSEDAQKLTNALKGESKTQGNWGEMQLDMLLENSGLTKGIEYTVQDSLTTLDGRRLQPDVIIHLPEKKEIVVDSKVSLTAYELLANNEDEDGRKAALKQHIASVRNHVKELSEKKYHNLYQLNTLDFVLMYIPIEAAFSLAVMNDTGLVRFAYERQIVMVSSSTLLATLKTIESIWRQEKQNRNAQLIAEKAGAMYDKFAGFFDDMTKLGTQMLTTQKSYNAAMNKFSTGKGNLLKRAHEIKTLGAKTTKVLPEDLSTESNELPETEQKQLKFSDSKKS